MREIEAARIRDAVERLCVEANKVLPEDVEMAMRCVAAKETDALPAAVMKDLCENLDACAGNWIFPVCQDTGMAVIFAEIGQEVHIIGSFEEAVNEGVRRGYLNGLLRCSVVADPIRRGNTGDNTPAILHTRLVSWGYNTPYSGAKRVWKRKYEPYKNVYPLCHRTGYHRFCCRNCAAGRRKCLPAYGSGSWYWRRL